MTKPYYESLGERYRAASPEVRAASKAHWLKCHRENLASGRQDMIIFTAQILAQISMVENEEHAA